MHGPQRLRYIEPAYFETRYVDEEPFAARVCAARINKLGLCANAQARCDQAPGAICAGSCSSDRDKVPQ